MTTFLVLVVIRLVVYLIVELKKRGQGRQKRGFHTENFCLNIIRRTVKSGSKSRCRPLTSCTA